MHSENLGRREVQVRREDVCWVIFCRGTSRFDFFHAALLVAVLIALASEFGTGNYNGDMDHEIYYGQRLLAGELIWVAEYHDKLFFVQLLHVLPAYFESILVLKFMALASCAGAVLCIWKLLPKIPGAGETWPLSVSHLSLIYLLIMILTPESISHISLFSGNFALMSMLLLLGCNGSAFRFLCAAALAAMAISLRPYLLLPILAVGLWYGLRTVQSIRTGVVPALRSLLIWTLVIGVFGAILNVAIYVLSGHMEVFWAGIMMLAQKATPDTVKSVIKAQAIFVRSAEWLMVLATTAGMLWLLLAIRLLREKPQAPMAWVDFGFLGLFFPMLLQLGFVFKHFWDHYFGFVFPFLFLAIFLFIQHLRKLLVPRSLAFMQGCMFSCVLFFVAQLSGRQRLI